MACCPSAFETERFDEGIDSFRSIVEGLSAERPFWMSTRGDASIGNRSALDAIGRALWTIEPQAIADAPTTPVRLSTEQLGISQAFLAALGATEVFADLGLPEIRRTDEETSVTLSQFVLWMKRANGDVLRHTSWSWGQQRLVAFALYLANNKSFVIADELVNGMHHEWIELCLREIGDRQCFITSQNPILVDFVELRSAEQIQRSFTLCSVVEHKPGRTARAWRNMTESEAQTLYEARSVGLQSTSEIMRFHGWW